MRGCVGSLFLQKLKRDLEKYCSLFSFIVCLLLSLHSLMLCLFVRLVLSKTASKYTILHENMSDCQTVSKYTRQSDVDSIEIHQTDQNTSDIISTRQTTRQHRNAPNSLKTCQTLSKHARQHQHMPDNLQIGQTASKHALTASNSAPHRLSTLFVASTCRLFFKLFTGYRSKPE